MGIFREEQGNQRIRRKGVASTKPSGWNLQWGKELDEGETVPSEIHNEDGVILHASVPISQVGATPHEIQTRASYSQELAERNQRRSHFFGFLFSLFFLILALIMIAHLSGWIELSWPSGGRTLED